MKAIVKAKLNGIFKNCPFTVISEIDFGDNSNIFGRIFTAHNFFAKAFNVDVGDVEIVDVKYI